jgi:hypothetical protein
MTLATHAIVGAMVAEFTPRYPVLGFILGFLSHLMIDSLPHYDYSLSSGVHVSDKDFRKYDLVLGRNFLSDLISMGIDCVGGFVIALALFSGTKWSMGIAMIGAFGGVLPDFLQFVYFKTHAKVLTALQRFHSALQKNNAFEKRPLPGLAIQIFTILILGIALRLSGRL